ncbi:hypothetical protein RF11_05313 [Thelohanellus kitauei]|uniref:Uncharacterized protein n=1 Tax=Thelohanellus kitauei TaxID=669202 RepID=A0A0C2MYJ2_THEKT|nr:hypothetical protein RF11_05313 [Thelohanellus kitauei]
MYEVTEKPEDLPYLSAGGQTETEGLSLAVPICVSLSGRFGDFAFPTPQLAVVNALYGIGHAVFERANLSNPYSSLLGYFVHATRDLARSRLTMIAWPTGLTGDSQVRPHRRTLDGGATWPRDVDGLDSGSNMPTAVSSTEGCHLTAGSSMIISSRAYIWPCLKTVRRAGVNDPRRSPPHQQMAAGPTPKTLWLPKLPLVV